jgi:hypothetical protein
LGGSFFGHGPALGDDPALGATGSDQQYLWLALANAKAQGRKLAANISFARTFEGDGQLFGALNADGPVSLGQFTASVLRKL